MIRDHAKRDIAQAQLSRERRFGHSRHSHHIGAVSLEPVDFGGGLEPRPLHRRVDASIDHRFARALRRV
jgi:hypothetical protein